jgi:hypothetical protein
MNSRQLAMSIFNSFTYRQNLLKKRPEAHHEEFVNRSGTGISLDSYKGIIITMQNVL